MSHRFGPMALHDDDEWRQRREAQIDAAIAANRERYDSLGRPRWLSRALDGWHFVAFLLAVVLLCGVVLVIALLSPITAIAAHIRGSMTP